MGTYDELKKAISDVIKENGNNEITGEILQSVLVQMVSIIGANATYAGIAVPSTTPGTADANVFYIATEPGLYVNFSNIEIFNGEIAILSNKKGIWEKNIIEGNYKAIKYHELSELKRLGTLKPGTFYRITDYITTAKGVVRTAGHPFDLVVLALSSSELSERAWAVHSERDVDGYFANSKLSAWQIWYSLDNDSERFAWADATNGKGVIYRMIDEWGNDVPYDFKNIIYVPLKSFIVEQYGEQHTYTENGDIVNLNGVDYYGYVRSKTSSGPPPPPETLFTEGQTLSLGMNLYTGPEMTLYPQAEVIEILPVSEVSYYTFSAGNVGDVVDISYDGKLVSNNVIKPYRKELKTYINSIIFIGRCHNNVIGFNCHDISFMAQAEAYSQNNLNNIIGNECHSITFKGGANGNRLGNNCTTIEFGVECGNNNVGNNCREILFGGFCNYNTIETYCSAISLGNNNISNVIATSSSNIEFGIHVNRNSVGMYSYSITIGNGSVLNIFEGWNSRIEIPENSSENRFEARVTSVNVERRNGAVLEKYCIKRGMQSDYTIIVTQTRSYETVVARNSSGETVEFCMADIASKVDEITITVDE